MARALLILGWLATIVFVVSALTGFFLAPGNSIGTHLLLGLFSSVLLLFSHCWIMFFLIGTGKAVKVAAIENTLDSEFVEETKAFKNRTYPWMMLAMGLAMATFILGGGVATKVVPVWVHSTLFAATVLVQLKTLRLEGEVLEANRVLMRRVEDQLAVL